MEMPDEDAGLHGKDGENVTRASPVARVPFGMLVPFLLISFGLAWGILALFVFFPEQMNKAFGELTGQHPLFFLAVYAPAIAALVIVTWCSGYAGVRRYFSRLLIWRCSPAWYGFLLIGIPLVYYGSSALKGDPFPGSFPFSSFKAFMLALFFTAIKGPVEELGWRGLALPLIQRKVAPLWAGLVLGVIWGFWHLPAFLLSGTPQGAWSFTPFFAGSVAVSVIATALFNKSGGSILLPALLHFQLNNPLWPDAQPYDMFVFVAVALWVVWFKRKELLDCETGVKEVIPQPEGR
jgi:membrane protease YdiL (CAAX protease family)